MGRFENDDEQDVERDVTPALTVGEGDIDASLRPRSLGEFIGQPRVREQLQLVLEGAKNRGGTPDHILLSGPPGLGKTSLAMIIASELGTSLRVTSGPALERAGDLAAMLSNLVEHDVLFIDEIHRIARPAEEMLYLAMEDFRVDVVVGKGPGATSIPLEVAPFTLVGATTRSGALTGPLRDRFGFTAHMDFYEPAELERVLARSAGILGIEVGAEAGAEIARRSRGTPRIANRLLRRVRDYAEVRADGVITRDIAKAALAVYDVDELGLDRLDRAVLSALTRSFGGGPVGVSTLAVAVGEEATTVEEVCEPFLVRAGDDRANTPRPGGHPTSLDPPRHGATTARQWAGPRRIIRMIAAALAFAALAALLHVYIFVMESFTWTTPRTRKVFGTSAEEAETTKLLAFNQGFYNLFLAIVTVVGIGAIAMGHKQIGAALVFAGVGSEVLAAAVVLLAASPDKARAAVTQGTFPLIAVVLLVIAVV